MNKLNYIIHAFRLIINTSRLINTKIISSSCSCFSLKFIIVCLRFYLEYRFLLIFWLVYHLSFNLILNLPLGLPNLLHPSHHLDHWSRNMLSWHMLCKDRGMCPKIIDCCCLFLSRDQTRNSHRLLSLLLWPKAFCWRCSKQHYLRPCPWLQPQFYFQNINFLKTQKRV